MLESLPPDNIKNVFSSYYLFILSGLINKEFMQRQNNFFRILSNVLIINLMINMLQIVNIKSNIASVFFKTCNCNLANFNKYCQNFCAVQSLNIFVCCKIYCSMRCKKIHITTFI